MSQAAHVLEQGGPGADTVTVRSLHRGRPLGPDAPFEELLAAAVRGDHAGFEGLFRRFDRRLAAFARMRGASDPEGLVNEVFLQAFRNLDGFRGDEAGFTSWIFTIARNKLIDDARRAERRPVEVAEEHRSSAVDPGGGDAETEALDRLSSGEVRRMLDGLTPDQRDVVLLRVVADLSLAETAGALGKPVTAVKALQRRALAALAREISTHPYPDPTTVRSPE